MNVNYSYDGEKLLGTGGAIKNAERYLDETFFVLYGDSYLDIDYKAVSETYKLRRKEGLMTIYKNENRWDSSNVVYKNRELLKYSKLDKSPDMNYIDYGLGILAKNSLSSIKQGAVCDLAEIYENLSVKNQLAGFEVFHRFYEIGSKEGLAELNALLGEAHGQK
jgi:NDP-sugar pyrophosphorylase family protein